MRHDPALSALQPALARLKADLAAQRAPPMPMPMPRSARRPVAQVALAGAGVATGPVAGPPRFGGVLVWVGAALLATLALAWSLRPVPGAPPRPGPLPAGDLAEVDDTRSSGFLPVAPPERFAELWRGGAQAAPAWVVRTELPRERLAAFGLPYDPARAGEPVRAELLMHPAGDVLAVRLTP